MFKIFICLIFLSPFLVCDPQVGVDYYTISGLPPGMDGSRITPQANGSLKFDLVGMPSVTVDTVRNITVSTCKQADDTHTGGCSSPVPFGFTQSVPPASPKNVKLGL